MVPLKSHGVRIVLVIGLAFVAWLSSNALQGRPSRRAARLAQERPVERPASAVPEPVTIPPVSSEAPTAPPDDPALAEILRIRATHGSVLKGSLLEGIFAESTTDRSDQAQSSRPNLPGTVPLDSDPFQAALRQVAQDSRDPAQESPERSGPSAGSSWREEGKSSADERLIRWLRATGRQLDSQANDLEEVRRFADAERLRSLADSLRQEARRLDGDSR